MSAVRTLAGRTILVTRPAGQEKGLMRRLEALGASAVHVPTIRIDGPTDREPLESAVRRLASYDWLVLTSVNGVERLERALDALEAPTSPLLAGLRVAAIGPATADRARELGARPAVVPDAYRAEALVEAILESTPDPDDAAPLRGRRVLLPRAAEARAVLPERLREAGATVDEVPAYETRVERAGRERLASLLDDGALDWLTFTASSTVRAYVELVGPRTGGARVATIGPITAGTARSLSLPVHVTASEYTTEGLVEAIVRHAGEPADAGAPPPGS